MASPAYRTSAGTIGTNPSVNVAVTGDYAIVAAITPSGTPTMGNANYVLAGSQAASSGTAKLWVWVNTLVTADFDPVTVTAVTDTEAVMLCYTGATAVAPQIASGTTSTAPSVDADNGAATLVCIGRWSYGTSSDRNIAPPSGMTERYDTVGAELFTAEIADQAIADPGATGTRAYSPGSPSTSLTMSLVIPSVAGFPVGVVPI